MFSVIRCRFIDPPLGQGSLRKDALSRMLYNVVFRGAGLSVGKMLSLQINTVEFRQLETLSLFAPSQNFCETLRVKVTQNLLKIRLRQMGYTSAFIFPEYKHLLL